MRQLVLPTFLFAALLLTGCDGTELSVNEPRQESAAAVAELVSPAAPGSGEPFLSAGPDDSLLMSWLEPSPAGHALRFARYADDEWSEPRTIAESPDFFVNWADFPSIVETAEGTLVAHWLQKSGEATYAYDVRISLSSDGGASWSDPVTLHNDGVETEHGFVSLVPESNGSTVAVAWLDGRNMTGDGHGHGEGSMTVRFARIHPDGSITERTELDDRVCECCQTSMVESDGRLLLVYRDRSENEVRDIGIVREQEDGWSAPSLVHEDGWTIAACPVNGPQIDAMGSNVAMAWFTEATGDGQVHAVFSTDRGETFGDPIRLDEFAPLGRVDTILLDDDTALVVWLTRAEAEGRIVARKVSRDGTMSEILTIGRSESSRASGFPRMAIIGERVFVSWTEPGEPARIHFVEIDPEEIS